MQKSHTTSGMLNRKPSIDDYLYRILRVDKTATLLDIEDAYQVLALDYFAHKSANNAKAAKKFRKIFRAYTVLSDSHSRRIYDDFGMTGLYTIDLIGEDKLNRYTRSRKSVIYLILMAVMTCCFCCFCCCCGQCCLKRDVDYDSDDCDRSDVH